MNSHDIEALEYPSAHRDRARELMSRRAVLSVALEAVPARERSAQFHKRALIAAVAVIPLALLSALAAMFDLVADSVANTFSLFLIACSLIVFIVVALSDQSRYRRQILEAALHMTLSELDILRNDYTSSEGEYINSDLAMASILETDPRETSNKVVLITATIAFIGTLGVLVWEISKAFIS